MNQLTSRKMADMPILKLIFNMSLPAIISMLVQALYNVVDSLFIARYSTPFLDQIGMSSAALDALTIAFPMQMLVIAVAVGIGVGANAYISRMLGKKLYKEANYAAQHALLLAITCGVLFVIIGLFLSKPFVNLYTSNSIIAEFGTEYLTIVVSISIFVFLEITLTKMLQATGNMKIPMISQLIGAITNMILDPLLIFGIWIFPELGIKGAAIATVTGQGAAFIYSLSMFIFKKHDISISLKGFRLQKQYILAIIKIGLPTTIMNAINSVAITIINLIIKQYMYAITILGVYFRVQSFVFMPVFGLMQGALPVMSYNYGANDRERFKKTYLFTIIIAGSIMLIGMLLFLTIPQYIVQLFNLEANAVDIGIKAFRILSLAFLPAAVGITTISAYQALGKGFNALAMSFTRQLIFLVPGLILLSYLIGINGIWYAYFIGELASILIFVPIAYSVYKKAFSNLEIKNQQKLVADKKAGC